ncbi:MULTISPECIES: ChrR family anti-sigma-E factor [unclassified Agarivorans]|uniref:ChrR family anti-sigma-E factor n=1 Tax=unclassified Agarivorans TaxID=2636026 RepID=UPI003D7D0FF1
MTNVQFHPSDNSLELYAAGLLDPSMSIMVSAHLEFCGACRQRVAQLENSLASQLQQAEPVAINPQLDSMMQMIMQQTIPSQPTEPQQLQAKIKLDDKSFALPRVLQAHAKKIGPWARLPGKLQRARVDSVGDSKMNFIYMDQNSALPEHTHQGQEVTLVLAGRFIDNGGSYGPGDFVIRDTQHTHTPRTEADQDCLCLTLLDAPLHFTSGLASLLNPFSQLFFR